MARKVSGKSKLLFSGIVLGGLMGAVTALLTAPQSGVRTRRKIRERSLDIRDRTTDTIDESIYRAERSLADVRARMDDMSSKARRQTEEFVRRSEKELDTEFRIADKKGAAIKPVRCGRGPRFVDSGSVNASWRRGFD
ncbi:MAG: YtxH domain-containing protein [Anaerolineales bacterium]